MTEPPSLHHSCLGLSKNQCPSLPQQAHLVEKEEDILFEASTAQQDTMSCETTQQLELPGNPTSIQRRQLGGCVKDLLTSRRLSPLSSSLTHTQGLLFTEESHAHEGLLMLGVLALTSRVLRVVPKMCISNTFPRDLLLLVVVQ